MAHPPLIHTPRGRPRDERGVSLSVFVATVVVALLAMGGLVMDGGALSVATRECQQVASEAARAAVDAGALRRAAGLSDDKSEMRAAAQGVLNAYGVAGEVAFEDGAVVVRTRATVETTFLSLIRINELRTDGESRAELRSGG